VRYQTVKPLILIVEDHDAVRASLRDWLSASFSGCRFLEAKSGEEAVALACAQSPDLILMDIVLPQMNGIEATRRIKAALPQVQVVILTMHENSAYQADAAAAGASAYVLKRTMRTELIPVVAGILSHRADAVLDPERGVSQDQEAQ
jgi:DNA-binding NarL/FixJ family response regulator